MVEADLVGLRRPPPGANLRASRCLARGSLHSLTFNFFSFFQNKPPRRNIPGIAFFSYLGSLLKWVFLIVLVVVGVMAFRGWKAKQSLKRF